MGRPGVDESHAESSASVVHTAHRGTKVQYKMAKRRRREAVTWFPNIGTHPAEADAISSLAFTLTANNNTENITGVLPLTFDYPQEGNDLDPTVDGLSEIIGSEYICKRIVGKLFAYAQGDADTNNEAILFGAGIFVARADPITGPNGANSPIGRVNEIDDNYGPLSMDTTREPWMWRRTWILGNQTYATVRANAGLNARAAVYPYSTAGYGSMSDGPHVDVRVKRRVGQDDRLWLALSIRPYPLASTGLASPVDVKGLFDYRILGSLRKAKNSSAF